ncbi:alpha/beta fold hydrolase [Komagataeibacter intermedius]|uniref:Esterase n=2 Tax=Komagataeibacter intermedius TaxID=66229 RepID=A0A0N1FKT0_9PROT|nr:alpha/beta fold hydrolase [Komagataeibacter intermedius]KPH86731.1 esterase [Komagataeibacter intermedius AF2]MCF3636978.1 alpha/beta fold hydrolase [Komagataeibacter intermedius]GAN86606.1 hydrolase/esterase/lipase [Komagataeibacter intermedius TF2]GBQ76001.1 esterase [Komagataeibacter intermedius NRIC 0521]
MLLNTIELGPENGDLSLPPVVFLHGLFGRARNFGFFQRRIAATRRTLALDLRNHGQSPHGPMDYPVLAADVCETLATHGALPATVVGHSMGGKTAMMLALSFPADVHSLMVVDIAPGEGGFSQSHQLARNLAALPLPDFLDRAGAEAWLGQVIAEKPVRDLMLMNLELGEKPHWTIGLKDMAASMPAIIGWPDVLPGVHYDGPTLFVAGGRSHYIQPDNYPAMRRLFPHYRLEVIPDAGHWVHAQAPQAFLNALEYFLRVA